MLANLIRSSLLGALLLVAMWATSLWIYDREKMSDALEWRWAELNDEPLFRWPFNSHMELSGGHGLRVFSWFDGTVSGNLDDPYFLLNLEGRNIDARRFHLLRLRLHSDDENELRLFHFQDDADVIHASERIPLQAGWQDLSISLQELEWRSRKLSDPAGQESPSSWGGNRGIVTALRVDPVRDGPFEVDWIELSDAGRRPQPTADISYFSALADPLFQTMAEQPGRTWHIAHQGWLRTPESSHWQRRQIAAEFPSAVVFPRPPEASELSYPPFETGPLSAFIPACVFIAALLFLVARDQIPPPWRQLVSVVVLFALVESYLYWMPSLSSAWRVLVAVPVLGALWELAPKTRPDFIPGNPRAWLMVSPILAASALLLLLSPDRGLEADPLHRELVVYFFWAVFQQFIVAELVYERLKSVAGKSAIVLSAGFFGFMHFPNFALMVATFLLGVALLHIYDRYRNLLAISTAHAFIAVSFNTLALQYVWLSRTVGPEFTAGL